MIKEGLDIFFTPLWSGLILCLLFLALAIYLAKKWPSLDWRQFIRHHLTFAILMTLVIGIYVFIITMLSNLADGLISADESSHANLPLALRQVVASLTYFLGNFNEFEVMIITGAIMFLLVAISIEPLKKFLEGITDRFLFKREYQPQELLASLAEVANSTLNEDELLKSVIDNLSRAFHPESLAIFLTEKKGGDFILSAKNDHFWPVGHHLPPDDPLVELLERSKRGLVLKILRHRFKDNKAIKTLEFLEAAIAVPIYSQEDLVGFMLLGIKKSGDDYNLSDLKILGAIADQLSIALVRARLYGELENFNLTLKEQVESATADLRAANKRLSDLDRIKSDFISIASHKLRTPLTVIKGYVSMILDGSFGRVPKNQKEALEKVFVSNERMVRLVDNLLEVYHIDSNKMKFNWQSIVLTDLASMIVNEFMASAKKKSLTLDFILPKGELPTVRADQEKIREVIINLLDNAIKYTAQGGIKVKLEQINHDVVFSCSDTGVGIRPEDISKLFQKFSRAPGISLIDTESTGIGLYVAKRIIGLHGGRIWAESAGENKGSRFSFALPLENN